MHQLHKEDLVLILLQPKNALVKQYQRNSSGTTRSSCISPTTPCGRSPTKRETGARGLRSIIEAALLDVMFELPSRTDVSKCVITRETIARDLKPTRVADGGASLDDDELDAVAEA